MRSVLGRVLLAVATLAALVVSPPPDVAAAAVTAPGPRFGAPMAYDAATGSTVLFGGQSPAGVSFSETWTWSGSAWTLETPTTSPPGGAGKTMAYDAATETVVLFGRTAETWIWDGRMRTWTEQTPALRPPPRSAAVMAYDEATRTVLLFGGNGPSAVVLSDTWAWNGATSTWSLRVPAASPAPRSRSTLAADPTSGRLVLFGGLGAGNNFLGDTWTWDGTAGDWTEEAPTASPPARYDAHLAPHAGTGRTVLFGGSSITPQNDTWTWDATQRSWSQEQPGESPFPRCCGAMAAHPPSGTVMLFGGLARNGQILGDTWAWNGTTWAAPAGFTAPPLVSVGDVTVAEGDAGGRVAVFTVSLSGPTAETVTVNYEIVGTTASPSDFNQRSGTLSLAPGVVSGSVKVQVHGDFAQEGDETFEVTVSSAANAILSDDVGVGTIADDDPAGTTAARLAIGDVSVHEGDGGTRIAVFNVSLSRPLAGSAVTLSYATARGTATKPGDYTGISGTLRFAPRTSSSSVKVVVQPDQLVEEDETFSVKLSGAAGATIADAIGVGTIIDDD